MCPFFLIIPLLKNESGSNQDQCKCTILLSVVTGYAMTVLKQYTTIFNQILHAINKIISNGMSSL
jgi:hypothetical protein